MARWRADTLLTDDLGNQLGPWALERANRTVRGQVQGLPDTFVFHDLRHNFASLLIASMPNPEVAQRWMRHASM